MTTSLKEIFLTTIATHVGKCLVQGFIHETEHLLFQTDADIIVPDLVINLCILFYAFFDRFHPNCIGSDMNFTVWFSYLVIFLLQKILLAISLLLV